MSAGSGVPGAVSAAPPPPVRTPAPALDGSVSAGAVAAAAELAPNSAAELAAALGDAERALVAETLDALCKHKTAELFAEPVTEEEAPGYAAFTAEPMDLRTLRALVAAGAVATVPELRAKLALIVSNCKEYNKGEVSRWGARGVGSGGHCARSFAHGGA